MKILPQRTFCLVSKCEDPRKRGPIVGVEQPLLCAVIEAIGPEVTTKKVGELYLWEGSGISVMGDGDVNFGLLHEAQAAVKLDVAPDQIKRTDSVRALMKATTEAQIIKPGGKKVIVH